MSIRQLGTVIMAGVAIGTSGLAKEPFPFQVVVSPARAVAVVAHRGGSGQAPENTRPAILHAVYDGLEWIEVDIRLTKDKQHVLFRDERLDAKTNGKGLVRAHTLTELAALDAGSWYAPRFSTARILSLAGALDIAKGKINLRLDCHEADAEALVREILSAGMERQVVISGREELLKDVRECSRGKVAILAERPAERKIDEWVREVRPAAVEIDAADIHEEDCQALHQLGVKVEANTLGDSDKPETWDRVIAAGADWIRTDRPEVLIARVAKQRIGANSNASRVRISHHRGASIYAPENTLPAFEKSIAMGADFVEFDVRTSADGGFFLLHDSTLNRTTNGKGPIAGQPSNVLATLDAGSWFGANYRGQRVPTLDEFLEHVGKRVELYVDAKSIEPEKLTAALARHGVVETSVVYQGIDYLERLRKIDPRIRRMPPLGNAKEIAAIAERVEPYAFDTNWSILSKELIDECHRRKILVFSDALGLHERPAEYQRAARMGIDVIQTDHPLRVLKALETMDAGGAGRAR